MRPCSLRVLRQRFRKRNVSEPNPNPSWKRHLQLKYFWILRALPIGRFYWTPAHSFPMTESQLRWENHWESTLCFCCLFRISLLDLFSLYRAGHWLSLDKRRNALHWSICLLRLARPFTTAKSSFDWLYIEILDAACWRNYMHTLPSCCLPFPQSLRECCMIYFFQPSTNHIRVLFTKWNLLTANTIPSKIISTFRLQSNGLDFQVRDGLRMCRGTIQDCVHLRIVFAWLVSILIVSFRFRCVNRRIYRASHNNKQTAWE